MNARHPAMHTTHTVLGKSTDGLFQPACKDAVQTWNVHRVVFGGAVPTTQSLSLEGGKEFGTPNFLDRRELGVVNLGGNGRVLVDGEVQTLANSDGLYVGMGKVSVSFESDDQANPAKFYIVSSPAHATYPTVHITRENANSRKLGAPEICNVRTIYQYVH
ncbi:MAG: 5-deoxy-glucuronate isomerase, partial [Planctomycetota bacterium]